MPTRFCTCCAEDVYNRRRCSFQRNLLDSNLRGKWTNQLSDKPHLCEEDAHTSETAASIHQPEHVTFERWYRKKRFSSSSQCNTSHAKSCSMSNTMTGTTSLGFVNSSEREQMLYKLLEEIAGKYLRGSHL